MILVNRYYGVTLCTFLFMLNTLTADTNIQKNLKQFAFGYDNGFSIRYFLSRIYGLELLINYNYLYSEGNTLGDFDTINNKF